jgi:hypothetical protein
MAPALKSGFLSRSLVYKGVPAESTQPHPQLSVSVAPNVLKPSGPQGMLRVNILEGLQMLKSSAETVRLRAPIPPVA